MGGYTICFGLQAQAGLALITTGLATTTYHAQNINYERSYTGSDRIGYIPSYTSELGYLDEKTVIWKNTNPFDGAVSEDVVVVDEAGVTGKGTPSFSS